MLTTLRVSRFRAFRTFGLEGLTRVNLLVGLNNAGKTCVLEAAEIVLVGGLPWVLLRSPTRREDGFYPLREGEPRGTVELRHLFHGHRMDAGIGFEIEAAENGKARWVKCELVEAPQSVSSDPELALLEMGELPSLALSIRGDQTGEMEHVLPLSGGRRLPINAAAAPRNGPAARSPINFVGPTSQGYAIETLWDRVVLTVHEQKVIEAVRVIEPDIERIAALSRTAPRGQPSGFVVKMRGSDEPVPIGTMGDGIKHLLILAVNLVSAAKGALLVDEIDTGLHHSVMSKMWRLVIETAERLDVQVFATTHSLDCLRALAWACEDVPALRHAVSVHRIDRSRDAATRYGAEELAVAIEQDMEIR